MGTFFLLATTSRRGASKEPVSNARFRGSHWTRRTRTKSLRENRKRNSRSLHRATPDFLLSLEALANFMGLSLLKAAHALMQVTPTTSHGYQDRRVANWSGAGS